MAKKTILIVDRDPVKASAVGSVLSEDYSIKVAGSGREGLQQAFSALELDLIVLNVSLPDMNGHRVCAILKSNRITREVPILFLLEGSSADEQLAFDVGAADVLSNGTSSATLRARVRTHIALREARSFLRSQNRYIEDETSRAVITYPGWDGEQSASDFFGRVA